ncbi:hypothetical protein [Chryseobacterium sp. JK1]|uniref:hypothetical protein n=1 Tax=Chryseobacterium sp. JK1 TaxID=874294 RepID=UPI003D6895D7
MKTKYLLYALACTLSIGKIKAADLYVRDLGAGGAYATISAAITAANNGDRIIIKPKIGNVPYLENISINKSLTFVSETNFSKYYIQGTIVIVPAADRVVNIHNMYAFQSNVGITPTPFTGGRCTVNIANCTVDMNLNFADTKNVTTNVYGSSFNSLYFVHGKIIGNITNDIHLRSDAAPLALSDIYINANKSNWIDLITTNYPLNVLNNDVSNTGTSFGSLEIKDIKSGSTNTIQNNRFLTTALNASFAPIYINTGNTTGIVNISNNILNSGTANVSEIVASAAITVIANYNLSTSPFNTTGVDIQNNNIGSANYSLDLNNLTFSGAIINAGTPDEEYQDLDLTRNDIGPLGGSNSWINYWPSTAGNKPRVMFLNTPRRVYQGTTSIQAEATGISK